MAGSKTSLLKKLTKDCYVAQVGSTGLQLYVLDTQVKRGDMRSTDHHLAVNWMGRGLDRLGGLTVKVCWERLAESPVYSHLQESLNQTLTEAG